METTLGEWLKHCRDAAELDRVARDVLHQARSVAGGTEPPGSISHQRFGVRERTGRCRLVSLASPPSAPRLDQHPLADDAATQRHDTVPLLYLLTALRAAVVAPELWDRFAGANAAGELLVSAIDLERPEESELAALLRNASDPTLAYLSQQLWEFRVLPFGDVPTLAELLDVLAGTELVSSPEPDPPEPQPPISPVPPVAPPPPPPPPVPPPPPLQPEPQPPPLPEPRGAEPPKRARNLADLRKLHAQGLTAQLGSPAAAPVSPVTPPPVIVSPIAPPVSPPPVAIVPPPIASAVVETPPALAPPPPEPIAAPPKPIVTPAIPVRVAASDLLECLRRGDDDGVRRAFDVATIRGTPHSPEDRRLIADWVARHFRDPRSLGLERGFPSQMIHFDRCCYSIHWRWDNARLADRVCVGVCETAPVAGQSPREVRLLKAREVRFPTRSIDKLETSPEWAGFRVALWAVMDLGDDHVVYSDPLVFDQPLAEEPDDSPAWKRLFGRFRKPRG